MLTPKQARTRSEAIGERWGAMNCTSSTLRGRRVRQFGFGVIAAGILMLGPWVTAQDAPPGAPPGQQGDPAARAVRLSSVEGQVQVTQGNQILASPALPNTPLFEGTQVSTGDDGRAEIQLEDGSVARISPNSSMTLGTLSQTATELQLNNGLGYFEIQGNTPTNQIRVRFGDSTASASG